MKIAIPVFHTKISPRFDQAQGFILVKVVDAEVISKEHLATAEWPAMEKMKHLVHLGIDTVICGAIDRTALQYLSLNRVNIYSWVTGEVDDAVACFLNNNMRPGIMVGERGKMKGRWQFCKGRNHLCNLFQADFYKDEKGVKTMPRGDGTGPQGKGPRSNSRVGCQAGKGGRGTGQGKGRGKGQGRGQGQGQGNRRQSN
jgi:predicted Fe-Mo cluster-binding NifX family protein